MYNLGDAAVQVLQPIYSRDRTPTAVVVGVCCLGLILFVVAAVIVLSLIPIYLPQRGNELVAHNNRTDGTTTITTDNVLAIHNNGTDGSTTITTGPEDIFFVFDFLNAKSGISMGGGGRTVAATAENFPALIGNGVAMTVGYISACGINLPHTHPRATEINIIVSGQFEAGLFQENSARFIMETISTGQATIFPQGAIHFEQNLNCEPAIFVAGFNSDDPGVQTIASSLFGGLPADIVGASLGGLNITSVDDLRRLLPTNPALGIELCRQRCGLK